MTHPKDLRILLPTNFSDACFKTGRAIAQLGDPFRIHLTIAHVVKPGAISVALRRELDSFLAEADHFDGCERKLIVSEDPAEGLANLAAQQKIDLVMTPASDRIGISRLLFPSFRARLMKLSQAPIWTVGPALDHLDFHDNLSTVACVVDFEQQSSRVLRLAAAFAGSIGARLRVIGVIPPVSEGDLAHPDDHSVPLSEAVGRERLQAALNGIRVPDLDIVIGDQWWKVGRILKSCQTNFVILGPGQSFVNGWIPRLRSYVDRLPCPALCVDGAASIFDRWTFESPSVQRPAAAGREDLAIAG